ncbi:MAG: RidA family protein [Acidimicrobiia bacterium]
MTIKRVNPPSLSPPTGFSHVVHGNGQVVFLAGQTAQDATGAIVGETVVDQFERALANLVEAITGAGASVDHLAKLVVYCTDVEGYLNSLKDLGRIWQRLVGREYPAMTFVGVQRLFDPAALIELDGFVIRP